MRVLETQMKPLQQLGMSPKHLHYELVIGYTRETDSWISASRRPPLVRGAIRDDPVDSDSGSWFGDGHLRVTAP